MYHPTTRALAVLELLQTHRRMSGPELAQRLAVDGRTVRRYIAMLEELGIPIATDRGRHGGYSLVAGYKLPPMMFSQEEALALSLGLLAARGAGIGEAATAVESAHAKLERVMPLQLQSRMRALAETVTLARERPLSATGNNQALLALSTAAQGRQRVHLRYRSAAGQETARDFDTYGLAFRAGYWYAVGMCHLRRDLRSFRLDRVQEVVALNASFTRPVEFDAVAQLTRGLATLPRLFAVELLLYTDLDNALRQLPGSIGLLEPTDEGVLLRGQADDLDIFARELTRLPFDFSVRTPRQLRDALRNQAARLSKLAGRIGS